MPSIIGTLEANETIKFILGKNEQVLKKKIFIFDGFDNRVKIMKTRDCNDSCDVCGKNKNFNKDSFEQFDYDKFISSSDNDL